MNTIKTDVLIIGAGAAGLLCAIEAGKRNRHVLVIDHVNKPGKKILMSGGGRCNFTNLHIHPEKYLSHNMHFCKSALSRYTQWDFIALVKKHRIAYHEKKHGQLFCDDKAKDILNMLLQECEQHGAKIQLNEKIENITQLNPNQFKITSDKTTYECESLVIATGGLSIPTLGATPFGYRVAEQFLIKVWPTRAGLVPLTLHNSDKEQFSELSGISNDSFVGVPSMEYRESILFTHRGLSGPSILQISSYWQPGQTVTINLLPDINLLTKLKAAQHQHPKRSLKEYLADFLPKRVALAFLKPDIANQPLHSITTPQLEDIAEQFHVWRIKPNGTEGYRTAEVTLGGVDCNAISSKTMEANGVKGLYFIGEVLDVTGWLGGFNFQWAWSSGWAAGQVA